MHDDDDEDWYQCPDCGALEGRVHETDCCASMPIDPHPQAASGYAPHESPQTPQQVAVFVLCRGAYEDNSPVGVYAQLADAMAAIPGFEWEVLNDGHWVNWMGDPQPRGDDVGVIYQFVIRKGL